MGSGEHFFVERLMELLIIGLLFLLLSFGSFCDFFFGLLFAVVNRNAVWMGLENSFWRAVVHAHASWVADGAAG